ncbi:MAG: DNA-processing protein DprA [Bacteroidales bacterium]|nr:DNA-processing protein DprA [Bacteroidales bacterium]
MYSEIFYRLALQYLEDYKPSMLKEMLRYSGTAKALFETPETWQSRVNKRTVKKPLPKISDAIKRTVSEELMLMERNNISYCFYTDEFFPYRLRSCSDSPLAFYYRGNADIFQLPHIIAMVGTRDATEYGQQCVRKIIRELQETNLVTISGLAYGIDTEAHTRSVEYNIPTIAVMGCGFSTIYPFQNQQLAQRIVDNGGALITEYSFRTPPDRNNFPKRNRIIAGMADAVLVVETGYKGGSIITAHIAHSYNRDVFALPGSIFDEHHNGCHNLIHKNIAALVTSGQEIINLMNWETSSAPMQMQLFADLDETEQKVISLLREQSLMSIDLLSEQMSELSPSKLAGVLLGLELKGVIETRPGKSYSLVR